MVSKVKKPAIWSDHFQIAGFLQKLMSERFVFKK